MGSRGARCQGRVLRYQSAVNNQGQRAARARRELDARWTHVELIGRDAHRGQEAVRNSVTDVATLELEDEEANPNEGHNDAVELEPERALLGGRPVSRVGVDGGGDRSLVRLDVVLVLDCASKAERVCQHPATVRSASARPS